MKVAAVIVTYKRAEVLRLTLAAVVAQSRSPDFVVVVDNDADPEIREIAQDASAGYVALRDNPGYGAALSAGMRHVEKHFDPDWYWLLDDDTPPSATELAAGLVVTESSLRPSVVATRGGHITWGRVRHDLQSVRMTTVADFTLVDGTLVSRSAVAAAGFPREDLFMMCEDLDYTTRIASAGGVLVVRPANPTPMHLGTSANWRGYYQARNHLRLSIDRRSISWLCGWTYRMIGLSCNDLLRGRWSLLGLRWRGALDGLRGRMGRTIF